MGEVRVPASAYFGAQSQRAADNFPISGWRLPTELIHALGLIKYAAAVVNRDLGKLAVSAKRPLSDEQIDALLAACREVADGNLDEEFPIDVFFSVWFFDYKTILWRATCAVSGSDTQCLVACQDPFIIFDGIIDECL